MTAVQFSLPSIVMGGPIPAACPHRELLAWDDQRRRVPCVACIWWIVYGPGGPGNAGAGALCSIAVRPARKPPKPPEAETFTLPTNPIVTHAFEQLAQRMAPVGAALEEAGRVMARSMTAGPIQFHDATTEEDRHRDRVRFQMQQDLRMSQAVADRVAMQQPFRIIVP